MEILTINYNIEHPTWSTVGLVLILLFFSIFFGLIILFMFKDECCGESGEKKLFLSSTIVMFCIIGAIVIPGHIKNFNKVEVKALIDDNTDFNEIYNNYEIVKREGKIYTLNYRVDRKTFDIDKERRENSCN